MSQSKILTRRKLLKAGIGSAPLLFIVERPVHAAGRLSVKDPQAVKFGYVENAKQVDAKRFLNYRQGQSCANCKLVAARYGFYRPCEIFPSYLVNEKGWCSAWVEKTKN